MKYVPILMSIGLLAGFAACDHAPAEVKSIPSTQPDNQGKVVLSDAEWKKKLTADQYYILREKGTEPAYHNAYFDSHDKGEYVCAACGLKLFLSDTKFDSHTGWPSFYAPATTQSVQEVTDADGERTELLCPRCGGHLGHVFKDGPKPTGLRYCMDSGAMKFIPAEATTKPADH